MAQRIQAINAYRPRIDQAQTVQKAALIRAVSRATGLVEGTVDLAVKELRDQIIEICRMGHAVKVDSLGTFAPNVDLAGNFSIAFRADAAFANGLNMPGTFGGTIINRENIGKTSDELIQKWNEDHPEDLVTFSAN